MLVAIRLGWEPAHRPVRVISGRPVVRIQHENAAVANPARGKNSPSRAPRKTARSSGGQSPRPRSRAWRGPLIVPRSAGDKYIHTATLPIAPDRLFFLEVKLRECLSGESRRHVPRSVWYWGRREARLLPDRVVGLNH